MHKGPVARGSGAIDRAPRHSSSGVFHGWRVVAASFLINAISDGTYFIGFTVLLLPISRDFNLSRTAISLPFALARILGGALGPPVGVLIDRAGPGRVLAVSALIGGLGFILLRWTDSYALFMVVFLGPLTVGMQSGFGSATSAAINQWFIRRRSLAMAIAQSGYSMGGGLIPPLFALGVQTVGWRTTAMAAGLGIWAIALPLAAQLRRSPESMGLRPDGVSSSAAASGSAAQYPERPAPAPREVPLREALRSRAYWLLALSFGFRGMVWGAVGVHLVPIMVWKGLPEPTAGYLVGLYAAAWAPAVLLMGWLGDRWSKQRIAGLGSLIGACGVALLVLWDQVTVWQMALVLVLLAPNEAGWSLGWAMLGELYGRRHFATLRGGMIAVQGLMAVGAPLYSGWVYDTTGGYAWVVLPATVLVGAAGLTVWFLPKPRGSAAAVPGGSGVKPGQG